MKTSLNHLKFVFLCIIDVVSEEPPTCGFRVQYKGSSLVPAWETIWYHFPENHLHINTFVASADQNSN